MPCRVAPQPEDHQVGRDGGLVGDDRADPPGVGVEAGDRLTEPQRHPEAVHRLGQHPAHVRVQTCQWGLPAVDDGDGHTPGAQRLGELQTDVAGADDDRPSRPVPLQSGPYRQSVVQGLHPEDPLRVGAGQRRADRRGAGGDHQLVEALPLLTAAVQVAHQDRAPVGVDGDNLSA